MRTRSCLASCHDIRQRPPGRRDGEVQQSSADYTWQRRYPCCHQRDDPNNGSIQFDNSRWKKSLNHLSHSVRRPGPLVEGAWRRSINVFRMLARLSKSIDGLQSDLRSFSGICTYSIMAAVRRGSSSGADGSTLKSQG